MAANISRRKIADYVAEQIEAGANIGDLLNRVAAYLVDARRTREVMLVVRAIEDKLAERGTVLASVTSARPLDVRLRAQIKAFIAAPKVYIRESVDPDLIGGVCIETPGHKLDATIQRKLLALRQAKQ